MIGRLVLWIAVGAWIFVGAWSVAGTVASAGTVSADPPVVEVWPLAEVWRISGDDPDAPLLGQIQQAVVDDDGNILMLDTQLAQVVVVAEDGEFLGTLSGKGEGPGELQTPNDLFLVSDGTVGLMQVYPKKIIRVTRDDVPAESFKSDSLMGVYQRVREADGVLVVSDQRMDGAGSDRAVSTYVHEIRRQSVAGEPLHSYLRKTTKTSINPPRYEEAATDFPSRIWDLTADGIVVLAAERDQYRIEFLAPDGETVRVIERDFESYRRTPDELKKLVEGQVFSVGNRKIPVKANFEPTRRAIKGLQVMADGAIWVSSCFADRDLPAGIYHRYDVFEADGRWRAEVQLQLAADREVDKLIALSDGRFLLVKNLRGAAEDEDEDAVLEVICLEKAQGE